MRANREIAAEWIRSLVSVLTADEANEVLIFGSAAVALRGVDLGRTINDLDVFASEETFQELAARFAVEKRDAPEGGTIPFIRPVKGADIEILKSIPGVAFQTVFSHARPLDGSQGLKVGSLADLRTWKQKQGRPKDVADIEAIDQFMNKAVEGG